MDAPKSLPAKKPFRRGFAGRKKTLILLSMMLPGAIWLLLIRYLPMFGIVIAFKDFKVYPPDPTLINSVIHSAWVGLENFKFIFATTDAAVMIRNTLGYNALWIVLTLVVSVAFAVMLNEVTKKFVAKTYQTMMFFPYFLSWVVVSYFVFAFLAPTDGLLSRAFGASDWYGNVKPWPLILTISNLWKNVGYSCILYMAAIAGIDTTQYEAASMDGATKWQQVWHVTLPHLRTMIMILLILNVGRIFNADFGLFYNVPMNSGSLYPATQVIDTYVYRALVAMHNTSMSTAAGLLQNVVGFIFIMLTNQAAKKIEPDSALF